MTTQLDLIKSSIKSIPNYPKEGIIFRDITSLLEVPSAFKATIDLIVEQYRDKGITKVLGTESRGFIFGAPVALALGLPFELVRKPKKLPRETISQSYQLEYGQDTLEMHIDAISEGDNVLIIDDFITWIDHCHKEGIERIFGSCSDCHLIWRYRIAVKTFKVGIDRCLEFWQA